MTLWENRADQEAWWFSDELISMRQQALKYYGKLIDAHWHAQIADAAIATNGRPVD